MLEGRVFALVVLGGTTRATHRPAHAPETECASVSAKSQESSCVETFFDGTDDVFRSHQHSSEPLPQSVVVGAKWRSLVHGYIDKKVGICLHFHARAVSRKSERGDITFVVQKESGPGNVNMRKRDAFRATNLGAGIGHPRTDDVKPSVPIYSRPVVQDSKSSIEIKNHAFWREIRNVVRLYRLNDGPTLLREWRSLEGVVVSAAFADGKFELILIG